MENQKSCNKERINRKIQAANSVNSGLTHECGVFAAIGNTKWPNNSEIAQIIRIGLEALQHRGQESTGLAISEGTNNFRVHKGMGLVKHVFNLDSVNRLNGTLGVGHTRYSTSASSEQINCQPFVVHSVHGALAVAHNGELVNCRRLREMVLERGIGLSTHSDSELITQALCLMPPEGENNGPNWPARIRHLMQLAPLSYSLVIMLRDRIYAVRDSYGNRPLCLGKIMPPDYHSYETDSSNDSDGAKAEVEPDGWLVSSESCAFINLMRYDREVLPGEIVMLTNQGYTSVDVVPLPEDKKLAFCIFEYVYFARPTSIFEGQEVYNVRKHCGQQLAIESPVDADIVGSVPESGNAAAHGFSLQSGIPFGELLAKNNYVGRTFIQPTDRLRQMNVALKFNPIMCNVRGKKIVLIDDSIVRGNTMRPIIRLLRRAGAKEVHIRVASPPLRYPCYMGINIPTRDELVANKLDAQQLAKHIEADSLEYLSVKGLLEAVQQDIRGGGDKNIGHCTACLTGEYPMGRPELDW